MTCRGGVAPRRRRLLVWTLALGLGFVGAAAPGARAEGVPAEGAPGEGAQVLPTMASTAVAGLDCSADVVFVGARASEQTASADTHGFGPEVDAVFSGFTSALAPGTTVQPVYVDYPAASTDPLFADYLALLADPADAGTIMGRDSFLQSAHVGVDQVAAVVNRVANLGCAGQALVLAGYSQGALVVHEGLSKADNDAEVAAATDARLGAVVLVADAASNGADTYGTAHGDDGQRGTAAEAGDADVTGRVGVLPGMLAQMPQLAQYEPMPAALDAAQAGRVLNVCDARDAICDSTPAQAVIDVASGPDGGPRSQVHGGYLASGTLPGYGRGAAFATNQLLGDGLAGLTLRPDAGLVAPTQAGSGLPSLVVGVPGQDASATFAAHAAGADASHTVRGDGFSLTFDGLGKVAVTCDEVACPPLTVQYVLDEGEILGSAGVSQLPSRVLSGELRVTMTGLASTGASSAGASGGGASSAGADTAHAKGGWANWLIGGAVVVVLVAGIVGLLRRHGRPLGSGRRA